MRAMSAAFIIGFMGSTCEGSPGAKWITACEIIEITISSKSRCARVRARYRHISGLRSARRGRARSSFQVLRHGAQLAPLRNERIDGRGRDALDFSDLLLPTCSR